MKKLKNILKIGFAFAILAVASSCVSLESDDKKQSTNERTDSC